VSLEETNPRRQCKLLIAGFKPYDTEAKKVDESDE
jgi:hypothetical protein